MDIERILLRKDSDPVIETVKMFDYWAFHDDDTVQFFQICEGKIVDYQYFEDAKDAPVVLMRGDIRYHGRAYVAPVNEGLNQ